MKSAVGFMQLAALRGKGWEVRRGGGGEVHRSKRFLDSTVDRDKLSDCPKNRNKTFRSVNVFRVPNTTCLELPSST